MIKKNISHVNNYPFYLLSLLYLGFRFISRVLRVSNNYNARIVNSIHVLLRVR